VRAETFASRPRAVRFAPRREGFWARLKRVMLGVSQPAVEEN
jgi:hypothetical protein